MVTPLLYVTCMKIGGVGHAHWRTGTGRQNIFPKMRSPRIRRIRG